MNDPDSAAPHAKRAKYRFEPAERWAVFTAHNSKCWLCGEPLSFTDLEVDHVLPEDLLEDKAKLTATLKAFNLPDDFELNSFENWLPTHSRCNNLKRSHVFRATPIIQYWVDRARNKADTARKIQEKTHRDKEIEKAVGVLLTAGDSLPKEAKETLATILGGQYASANSHARIVGYDFHTPGGDAMGMAMRTPIFKYVAPDEVRLGPGITLVLNRDPKPDPEGPFTFVIRTDPDGNITP